MTDFDQFRRFDPRQSDLVINRFAELRASHRMPGHGALPRLPEVNRPAKASSNSQTPASRFNQRAYQRNRLAPQLKPPPSASISTRSPRLIRPSATAASRASGIEAAEVLAWRSMVRTTFSGGRPSFAPDAVDDPAVGLMRHQPIDIRRR